MSAPRRDVDASALPDVVFGTRATTLWGTLGFMVIEGFTLVLSLAAYLYLRRNAPDWPPPRTALPALAVPTVSLVVLLAAIPALEWARRAAMRFDRRRVTLALALGAFLSLAATVLRWWDLQAIGARWDENAYASAAWAVVVLHGTLVLTDLFETGTLAVLFAVGAAREKHYPDVCDAAVYQWFLSLAWVPIYVIVYLGPRHLF
jgi:cytochrome c oxidase subunit 3